MNFRDIPFSLMEFSIGHNIFRWNWTDWIGLIALILCVTLVWVTVRAIRAGESPMKVFNAIGKLMTAAFKRKA